MTTREPLVIRAAIVAAAHALLNVFIVLGILPLNAEAKDAVDMAVDMIATAVLVLWTRGKVTPVDDPKLDIPAGTGTRRAADLIDVGEVGKVSVTVD